MPRRWGHCSARACCFLKLPCDPPMAVQGRVNKPYKAQTLLETEAHCKYRVLKRIYNPFTVPRGCAGPGEQAL